MSVAPWAPPADAVARSSRLHRCPVPTVVPQSGWAEAKPVVKAGNNSDARNQTREVAICATSTPTAPRLRPDDSDATHPSPRWTQTSACVTPTPDAPRRQPSTRRLIRLRGGGAGATSQG